jgi:hypothetical protein
MGQKSREAAIATSLGLIIRLILGLILRFTGLVAPVAAFELEPEGLGLLLNLALAGRVLFPFVVAAFAAGGLPSFHAHGLILGCSFCSIA